MNSSGVFKFHLDENLNVLKREHLGFTDVKKNACENDLGKIIHYNRKNFSHPMEKDIWMKEQIIDFVHDSEYAACEDFSYASTGKVFEIGAFVGSIKYALFEEGIKIRLYPPTSIKSFFCNFGNGTKLMMYEAFKELKINDLDYLNYLGVDMDEKGKSPLSDLVDAYAIGTVLLTELKLRRGLIQMKDLTEKQIMIFNKVQKKSKTNILAEDFIERKTK